MKRYAEKTDVSVSRSQIEIRNYLTAQGAKQFIQFEDMENKIAGIGFSIGNHKVKIMLPLPKPEDFRYTPTRQMRSTDAIERVFDQAVRQRWRALLLILKAKFEAVECGISTLEREFLADLLLPDGRSIEQFILPQLSQAYERGGYPKLLPWGEGEQ